jgi:hypothetical protein
LHSIYERLARGEVCSPTGLLFSLMEQINPGFSVQDYVTDAAMPVVIAAAKSCYGEIARMIVAGKLTHDLAFKYPGAPIFTQALSFLRYPTLAIKSPSSSERGAWTTTFRRRCSCT